MRKWLHLLVLCLGNSGNLTDPNKAGTYALSMRYQFSQIKNWRPLRTLDCRRMKSVTLPILFDPTKGADGLRDALTELCEKPKKQHVQSKMY